MTQFGGNWIQALTAVSSAVVSAVSAEEHLATEAVVAYVDGELSLPAHERATRHLAHCTLCTAEVAAQRQARTAVRSAGAPLMPASLLAALHAIPHSAELPAGPDELSIDENGRFVTAQRPLAASSLLLSAPLGSSPPLGTNPQFGVADPAPAAARNRTRRRLGGAGVVATGLVIGALTLAAPAEPSLPGSPRTGADTDSGPATDVPARFEFTQHTDAHLVRTGLAQR
jgi:anti-sigma factor RsiW